MTNQWIILLCLLPLVAGIVTLAMVNRIVASRVVGVLCLGTMLVLGLIWTVTLQFGDTAGSIFVTQGGGWPAPFGISLIFDSLSGILITTAALVALAAYIHGFSTISHNVERRYYHPLMMLLMFGVNLSFLTGDLFNLFVAFEILLMASYALLAIGAGRAQLRQAYKYVVLNLVASTIFVTAAGMVYGMMGTLNIADLARIVAETQLDPNRSLPTGFAALAVMLLLVFGLKSAIFPLWFWLPDTYYTAPISIAGLFGGLLTKVGVYTVLRTFPLVFAQGPPVAGMDPTPTRQLTLWILAISAGITMFLAVLGAVSQHTVRRILSVHVISQIGYMVFGIAVGLGVYVAQPKGQRSIVVAGLAGCVFHIVHNMIVKCSLFLCCGVMEKHAGTDDLDKLGGLLRRDVLLAVLFFIAAMSLVGMPPLSGFFGKMSIIMAGWEHLWWLSVLGLLTGALTLLSMLKIWSYGFWNPDHHVAVVRSADEVRRSNHAAYFGITMLVAAALLLGFGAEPVYRVALTAGEQLADPAPYMQAVLGEEALTDYHELRQQAQAALAGGDTALADAAAQSAAGDVTP